MLQAQHSRVEKETGHGSDATRASSLNGSHSLGTGAKASGSVRSELARVGQASSSELEFHGL